MLKFSHVDPPLPDMGPRASHNAVNSGLMKFHSVRQMFNKPHR